MKARSVPTAGRGHFPTPSNGTVFGMPLGPAFTVNVPCFMPLLLGAKVIAILQLFPTGKRRPGLHVERDASRAKSVGASVPLPRPSARLTMITGTLLLLVLITLTNLEPLLRRVFQL